MVKVYSFKAEKAARLDIFLRELLPPLFTNQKDGSAVFCNQECVSNSKIRRFIIAGAVRIDGQQCRVPSASVHAGSTVSVAVDSGKFFYEKLPDDIKFEVTKDSVLYEDDVIIIVNKPAFFPTEATIAGQRDNMHDAVVRWLWSENKSLRNAPYAGIMHRLDRDTSGVLLFTKSRTVNNAVHDMFEQHTARKVYRAVTVCPAAVPAEKFSADTFLGRISAKSSQGKWGSVPESRGGLHAHTDFTVLGHGFLEGIKVLYIEARPVTGRTHQIRVHLSSAGMPIIGDKLYGGSPAERMYLHALTLTFPHPVTGLTMTITAPLPPGFGSC
jgi:23S rRNA pseudouridine1911/1915/1917 synthase